MAREEHDREDLLAEATALVERVELALAEGAEHVVAGFRRDGSLSVYFGSDPAYHFNTRRELRRAYVGGRLYKAERGRLAALERRREPSRVVLLRHDLDEGETIAFLQALRARLDVLETALAAGRCRMVGEVPPDGKVANRLRQELAQHNGLPVIAHTPRAG